MRILGKIARRYLSERTIVGLHLDWLRYRARRRLPSVHSLAPPSSKLHLGCGSRLVEGWLNVDVCQSDFDVDFAKTPLPWQDGSFDCVVSQQVIEHLDVHFELIPLLKDIHRMMKKPGEIWLCCPDMEKVCKDYLESKGEVLYRDALKRGGTVLPDGMPFQQYINDIFYQDGGHKNLFDFGLLSWTLGQAGFQDCKRVEEEDLLKRFPEFPPRGDGVQAIYVRAET